MQYFYKPLYASGMEAMSFDPANGYVDEHTIASVADSLGAPILSVNPETHTVLLELDEEKRATIEQTTGVELFPNYQYSPAVLADDVTLLSPAITPAAAAGPHKYTFIVEGTDGQKVPDAQVVVRLGPKLFASARSGQDGEANFSLRDPEVTQVRAVPMQNYWCMSSTGGKAGGTRKLLV